MTTGVDEQTEEYENDDGTHTQIIENTRIIENQVNQSITGVRQNDVKEVPEAIQNSEQTELILSMICYTQHSYNVDMHICIDSSFGMHKQCSLKHPLIM